MDLPSDPLYFMLFVHVHIPGVVLMPSRVPVRVSSYANEGEHSQFSVVVEALQITFLQPVLNQSQRLVKL